MMVQCFPCAPDFPALLKELAKVSSLSSMFITTEWEAEDSVGIMSSSGSILEVGMK